MESRINQDLEHKTEAANRSHAISKGLLNSNYKRLVKHNFKKACKKTVFGARQHHKSLDLCQSTHITTMALKISVFASAALVAWI